MGLLLVATYYLIGSGIFGFLLICPALYFLKRGIKFKHDAGSIYYFLHYCHSGKCIKEEIVGEMLYFKKHFEKLHYGATSHKILRIYRGKDTM